MKILTHWLQGNGLDNETIKKYENVEIGKIPRI
jgi:hypothetical protein